MNALSLWCKSTAWLRAIDWVEVREMVACVLALVVLAGLLAVVYVLYWLECKITGQPMQK